MALATYSDLQTSILSWLNRPGDSATIPTADLIELFEADASTKLRTHWQETSTTLTTVANTGTYALPADMLEEREISDTSNNPIRVLEYLEPATLDQRFAFTETGKPIAYTVEGTNVRFAPVPDGVYTLRLEYFQKITPLSSSVNWLYQFFPHIYLFGSLAEAELFLGADSSDERFQIFLGRRDDLYERIRLADRKYRLGNSPLVMRSNFRTP
jgi:hypothetical protein